MNNLFTHHFGLVAALIHTVRLSYRLRSLKITWCVHYTMIHWPTLVVMAHRSLFLFLFVLYHASIILERRWTNVLRCLDVQCQLQLAIASNLFDIDLLVCDIGSFNSNVNVHLVFFTVVWNRLSAYWLA